MITSLANEPDRTIIHRLNCWTKLLCFLIFVPVSAFLLPSLWAAGLLVLFAVVFVAARLSVGRFWKAAGLYIMGLVVAIFLLSAFLLEGPLPARLAEALAFVVRLLVMLCFGMLFTMTTNPRELPGAFVRVGLPHRFGVTLLVAMRMLPLLSTRVRSIVDSQRARGLRLSLGQILVHRRLDLLGAVILPMLNATMKTATHMSDTLISRGYDPHGAVTCPPHPWSVIDAIVLAASLLLVVLSFLI